MKYRKYYFLTYLLVIHCFFAFAKNELPACPIEGAQVVYNESKIKQIEISFPFLNEIVDKLSRIHLAYISEISNEFYFELLGYDEKTKEWISLEEVKYLLKGSYPFFTKENKYKNNLAKKNLKTIAIAPSKNCETFEIQYKKENGILKIEILVDYLVASTCETMLWENSEHNVKSIDTICFRKNETDVEPERWISVFYDDYLAYKFDGRYHGKNIELKLIGLENHDVYYATLGFLFKNNERLYPFFSKFPVYLIDGNLYYANVEDYNHKSIWKNDAPLQNCGYIYGLQDYAIGKNDEVSYMTIENDGTIILYKNHLPYATATGKTIFSRPTYSPDGKKFYFIEGRPRGGYYYAFYLHGDFPIPPTMGFTLVGEFKFSRDSKFIATAVEDLQAKHWYILTGRILGPFDDTSDDYYFSEDSKIFFYKYYDSNSKSWVDAEENLE